MPTLVFTTNPKPDVSLGEFKHFLETADRAACLAQLPAMRRTCLC